MPDTARQVKMSPQRYATLLTFLLEGTYNCRELAELTDLHYITVLDYCRALHEKRLIYICRWDRDARGRDAVMVYKWGPGMTDATKRKLTRTEQQRRYRARQRALLSGDMTMVTYGTPVNVVSRPSETPVSALDIIFGSTNQ